MLLGKLSTPLVKVYQNGLQTIEASANYMVVSASKYIIGHPSVDFEVRFGNEIVENGEERFDILLRHNLTLTNEELGDWGSDDAALLDIIASKLSFSIVEKIQKDFHHTH